MPLLSEYGHAPLYQRCQADLLRRIERGEFAAEHPLPTEEDLCRAYGVSRITVRRAMTELIRLGLVSRRQGSGTFATRPRTHGKSLSLVGKLDSAMSFAEGVSHKLLARTTVTIPSEIARAFSVAATRVERLDVLYSRGLPFAHTAIFVPSRIARMIDDASIEDGMTSIFHLIEDKNGQSVAHADQTVAAVTAPPRVASALRLKPGCPVLRALRAYFSRDGQVIHSAMIHYHPERFDVAIRFIP